MKNGYPENKDIKAIKKQLNTIDFLQGALFLKDLIDQTDYGKANFIDKDNTFCICTGGWSGCEDIVNTACNTSWWIKYWQSTHKGGKYIFSKE